MNKSFFGSVIVSIALGCSLSSGSAQPYTISTIAGLAGTGGNADGTIKNSTYSFHYIRASVLDGPPKIVNLQNLNLQVRMPTGSFDEKGNPRYKTTGVSTDVDIRDGQKVVVGKSDMNNGESPLILVVTAKVVE